MMELLTTWGTAVGIFCVVGALMESLNRTIGGKAGDRGVKGFWYSWKRFMLLPLGALLGSAAHLLGLSSPFGEGVGAGILDGILAATVAGQAYSMFIGSAKARIRHKLAMKLPGSNLQPATAWGSLRPKSEASPPRTAPSPAAVKAPTQEDEP